MRTTGRLLLALTLLLLMAAGAFAQGTGTTSELRGTATSDGKPLPGVTVTITSPALQGSRTAVTGEGGGYVFPSLPPGLYTVSFTLEGMQKVNKKVQLSLAQQSRADVEMKVAGVSESLTVTAAAPAVLDTVETSRNFTQAQVSQLPVRRNIRDTVLLAPGVNSNGPNNQMTISGAPSFDNLYLVNGVVVNENLRGQPHNLFIEDAIQETTILTGGISAEYGRFTGGVVSTLTKSGGNEFSGSLRDSATNPSWIGNTDFPGDANHPSKLSSIYEGTLGGYAIRDRLWFFGAGRYSKGAPTNGFNAQVSTLSAKNYPGFSFLNTLDEKRGEAKLTGNITQKHTIVASYLDIKQTENNNFFGSIYDQASIVPQRELPNSLKALSYTGVLTPSLLIDGSASQKKFAFINSGAPSTDRIIGTLLLDSNARFNSPTFCGICSPEERNNDSAVLKGSYYLNTAHVGNHNFSVGAEEYKETRLVNNHQSGSDFRVTTTGTATFLPDDPTPYAHFDKSSVLRWQPILVDSTGDHLNTYSGFANDKISLGTHLNLNVGIRFDKNKAHDASGNLVSDDSNYSPRLGAMYDIRGDGRSRVNATYAKYVTKIVDGNVGGAGTIAGNPATFAWTYTGPVINPLDSSGNIIGTPVGPHDALNTVFNWFDSIGGTHNTNFLSVSIPGYSTQVLNPIKSPNVDEIDLGYGQQIGRTGYARLDLIDRKWHDFYATELNQSTGTVNVPIPGATKPVLGDLAILINDNSIKRHYEGAQLSYGWHPNNWNFGGGYTLAKLTGNDNTESDLTASSPTAPLAKYYPEILNYSQRLPMGYIYGDQRHRARVWGGYQFHFGAAGSLNTSVIQAADSGRAYSAVGTIDASGRNANFKYAGAPVIPSYYTGSQIGSTHNYYFSKPGAFRTPSVFATDLALNYELPVAHVTMFAQGQVLNIFNNSKINNIVLNVLDTNVKTARTDPTAGLTPFNPFTATPIECPQGDSAAQCKALGANWQKSNTFGQALTKDAFQNPRTYRFSVGARF